MALPKLETPTFKMNIPSTGAKVEYRPFLVKEEKILLMLSDDSSSRDKLSLMKKLVTTCIQSEIDFDELTTYDIEYIFIQLRAKSVGEGVSISGTCEDCGEKTPVTIDLEKDVVVKNLKNTKDGVSIKLNETVGITLKYPKFSDIGENLFEEEEDMTSILLKCIDTIYDDKTVYNCKDYTKKELKDFLSSFTMKNIEEMQSFFNEMPRISCETKYKCVSCKKDQKIEIEGLANFF